MATKTGYQYNNTPGHGKVLVFPSLIVAFDIDAPTPFFTETAAGRGKALDGIHLLLENCAEHYELGEYWVYQTGAGFHVIYEKPAYSIDDWIGCYQKASEQDGWSECDGHWGICHEKGRATLRVGLKRKSGHVPRPPDIALVYGKVDDLSPLHIRTHAQAIAQYQVYDEETQ